LTGNANVYSRACQGSCGPPAGPAFDDRKLEQFCEGELEMYTNSDIIEIGTAHELIIGMIKDFEAIDDPEPLTLSSEEIFEE
jgi:hypothetical protein